MIVQILLKSQLSSWCAIKCLVLKNIKARKKIEGINLKVHYLFVLYINVQFSFHQIKTISLNKQPKPVQLQ